jgi:2-polyprenyl-3-methyl-5-hydroxy-6-metoxy-1,4-benzoquinol methylase
MRPALVNDPKSIHVWSDGDNNLSELEIFFLNRYLAYVRDGDSILDIGCGRGKLIRFLMERGYKAVGIDLNQELINQATLEGLPVKQMDAVEAIRDESKDYNVFSMLDFVEHISIDALFEILEHISKKSGARVWIQTPNLESIMGIKFWFQVPSHITPLHPYVLRQILHKYNFEIIEEWTDYGGLPSKGFRRWVTLKFLSALLGPPMASLFVGGANICIVAEVKND